MATTQRIAMDRGKPGHTQAEASRREPTEVIVGFRLLDRGLAITFADRNEAVIPYPDLKRIAETEEMLLTGMRIGGGGAYITIDTSGAPIPIPHDVLREFVKAGSAERRRTADKERRITARAFGGRLKELRLAAGMTQEALARRAKASRWTIMRIERGVYLPKVSLMEAIARAMNLDIEQLLL